MIFETIFTASLLIFILWVLFSHHKTSEKKARLINMSFFSVDSVKEFTEEIDLMDIFKQMHLAGWNRFLYGDPYVGFEKVIKNGKAEYYIALPKKFEYFLEKNPCVSKIGGGGIPEGKYYSAAYLYRKQPKIRFGELKLNEEEGVALQILARHSHRSKGRFEMNVRVLAWADSPSRAHRILESEKFKSRTVKKDTFDFFHRIFENGKRVNMPFGELKDFLINRFVY